MSRVHAHENALVMPLGALSDIVSNLRAGGKRVVHVRGAFDLLDRAQISRLEAARKQGNALVVTVTAQAKAPSPPPLMPWNLRAEAIASLPFVTGVALDEDTPEASCAEVVGADIVIEEAEADKTDFVPDDRPSGLHVLDAGSRKDVVYEKREPYSAEAEVFLSHLRSRYTATDIIRALQSLSKLRVLVVGDAIIDEYSFVRPYGMPLKAPIIASQFLDQEAYAGGILAVANHLAGFCGEVTVATSLGEKDSRESFVRASLRGNVTPRFFFRPNAPSTVKRRYLRKFLLQKLFEVSFYDDTPMPRELDLEISAYLAAEAPKYDLVVVADFGHGFLSADNIATLCNTAPFLALNTQLNSINYGYHVVTKYPRANYICIDEEETRMACRDRRSSAVDLLHNLAQTMDCQVITVTRGHHGSLTYQRNGETVGVPILSRQVIDTIGAGDAYLAVTSPCVRMGYPAEMVGFIGNAVGALAVRIVGNQAAVGPEELFEFISILMSGR